LFCCCFLLLLLLLFFNHPSHSPTLPPAFFICQLLVGFHSLHACVEILEV
jgi:hypothetical protein